MQFCLCEEEKAELCRRFDSQKNGRYVIWKKLLFYQMTKYTKDSTYTLKPVEETNSYL